MAPREPATSHPFHSWTPPSKHSRAALPCGAVTLASTLALPSAAAACCIGPGGAVQGVQSVHLTGARTKGVLRSCCPLRRAHQLRRGGPGCLRSIPRSGRDCGRVRPGVKPPHGSPAMAEAGVPHEESTRAGRLQGRSRRCHPAWRRPAARKCCTAPAHAALQGKDRYPNPMTRTWGRKAAARG